MRKRNVGDEKDIEASMYKERTKEIMEIVNARRASSLNRRCRRCRRDPERSLRVWRLLRFPSPRPHRQRGTGRGCGTNHP